MEIFSCITNAGQVKDRFVRLGGLIDLKQPFELQNTGGKNG